MSGTFTLLSIAGGVALLLWAARMVRTGVDRAHGALLRRFLRSAAATRAGAALAGTLLAIGLQGSTAVALLVTGLIAGGVASTTVGLAVMLGADLGSALVVQVLSIDLSLLIPALLLVGVVVFQTGNRRSVRQTGRIIIGIALILVALGIISEASAPLRESPLLPLWTTYLSGDPLTAFLLAALLTWLMHSSVAAVLLIASLAAQSVLPLPLAIIFVLGVNLGGGIIAFVLTREHDRDARLVPLGNLIVRATTTIVALIAVQFLDVEALVADMAPAQAAVMAHVAFNAALVVLWLPFTGPILHLAGMLLPPTNETEPSDEELELERKTSLIPVTVTHPRRAIGNAAREILNMSETVSTMLHGVIDVLENGNRPRIEQLAKLDDVVDQQYLSIKLYLAEVGRQKLSKREARRCVELTTFCIRLEQVGDIIVKNLLSLAEKKRFLKVNFSKQGWRELSDLHDRVSANLELSLNVLVSGDRESARELLEEKESVRDLERASTGRHIERLRNGTVKSIETSEIHLDTVRDLIQINTLLTSVAYPILEESGELLDSRLISARS